MAKAEGLVLSFENETAIQPEVLETFKFNSLDKDLCVHIGTEEFSAVCPFSGLPDIAKIEIDYVPNTKCIELKSLKYYFVSFRNVGVYQERATQIIFEELRRTLFAPVSWKDAKLKVTSIYKTRGGFETTVTIGSVGK